MQKADIAYINNTFYRILKTSNNQTLVIDCLHPKMPFWTLRTQYTPLPEKQLYDALNISPPAEQDLAPDQIRIAHERYTLIALILYHLEKAQQLQTSSLPSQKSITSVSRLSAAICINI